MLDATFLIGYIICHHEVQVTKRTFIAITVD